MRAAVVTATLMHQRITNERTLVCVAVVTATLMHKHIAATPCKKKMHVRACMCTYIYRVLRPVSNRVSPVLAHKSKTWRETQKGTNQCCIRAVFTALFWLFAGCLHDACMQLSQMSAGMAGCESPYFFKNLFILDKGTTEL